ncbi:MAG: formyltransferase family protein [Deltaproteobacteria bacterium]|jgi:folate-dependent phosphoribosylglycinamide formyltransferase PurN
MAITPIFDPIKMKRPMRVAAFMSGSGTNIVKLMERERKLRNEEGDSPFHVVFLFSDRSDGSCHGEKIACEAGIPYISYDIRTFHRQRGLKRSVATPEGIGARRNFDRVAAKMVEAFDIDVIALGGYMSYVTLDRCINVHPADLSIRTPGGKRKYVGDQAVMDAIASGEGHLRSSTLWTDQGVDTGPLLMVSNPVEVDLPEPLQSLLKDKAKLTRVAQEHQQRLKEEGDWKIFPATLEMVARGRFAFDEEHRVYVDGLPVPDGYREEKDG